MTIAILDVPFRDIYIASALQTVFSVNFPFMSDTYLAVYQRASTDEPDNITQLLVLGVDYTVAGTGSETGGSITLTVGAAANDIVTILSVEPIDRTSVFNDLNSFTVTLNQQLNDLTIMVKQMDSVINQLIPKYRIDELVSESVRPLKLELPILNDGQTWVGQGNIGDSPDNIIAATAFPEELLDIDFIIGTADALLPNAQSLGSLGSGFLANSDGGATGTLFARSFLATANETTVTNGTGGGNVVIGIADNPILPGTEGFGFPSGTTAERPGAPVDGEARFNTTSGQWEGWNGAAWENFVDTGGTVVSASYVTLSDETGVLPASFSLGSLATGLVLNTVVLGVSTLTQATDGTDYLSPSTGATRALDNLALVAINTSLYPDTDNIMSLGDDNLRWEDIFAVNYKTGQIAADTMTLSAYDVNGAVYIPFITFTANNTPTCVLEDGVEATTQAAGDNSTLVATTAYADRMVPLAGGTMTGALILSGDPVVALGAVTKQYADALAAGIDIKDPVYAATTGALTAVYANGAAGVGATLTNSGALAAFAVDGVSPPINSRILVKNQGTTFENGIYELTTVGSGAVAWVLTRATDYDEPSEISTGDLIIVENGTANSATGWLETATVAAIGVDPITFSQFAVNTGANAALSNLVAVAINTSLISDTDVTDNLGSQAIRWNNIYSATLQTGDTAGDTLNIGAWDVDGAVFTSFITFTANNVPTAVIASGVTATTQAPGDNSTKLATTAYADTAAAAGGATVALDNLAGVAINTSLVSDTDVTDDLGTQGIRWKDIFAQTLNTGDTAADTLKLRGYDVDGAVFVDFITITANNTPTCALSGDITGVTQAANDNSTKLATTAYADAAGGGASASLGVTYLVSNGLFSN